MDKVIQVDEDDKIIGEISRKEAHEKGILHRVVATYVVNDKKQILIQVRADSQKADHSSAGHVDPGESYETAAKRELAEEIGITNIPLTEIGQTKSHDVGPQRPGRKYHIFRVYFCFAEPGKINPEEVTDVFWADPYQIFEDMKKDPNDKKYPNGFKQTLKVFLNNYNKVFKE